MSSMLACVSHSPIIMIRAKPPAEEPEINALYQDCIDAIHEFDPERVIIFGSDHFAGFHLRVMPAYCVGLAAEAVDDVGGFGGKLDVPQEDALALAKSLRANGFDPALSYEMRVDHAFSQPLHRLMGALDRYPVIPIFIGALAPPYLPFSRSHAVGTAVGKFTTKSKKRTLIIGSGGLSHHPTRYYPLLGEATPEVFAYQMKGAEGGSFTDDEWFTRLRIMHEEGAEMLVSGARTKEDIKLNPGFDEWFLDCFAAGDLAAFDALDADETFKRAGIGSLELHTWIAALAAHLAAGGALPDHRIYAPTLEYGIGYGMAFSQP
jgi:2,3-dihydroxyphenylpropionate 1,2-dioxygenase